MRPRVAHGRADIVGAVSDGTPGIAAAGKPAGYFASERADLVARLPRPLGRVLDVGCGEGGPAAHLRAAGAERIEGVEFQPEAAAVARERYDAVYVGDATEIVPELDGVFDTVLCYDILEHLADPAPLLAALRSRARPGASLHISVPNARYFELSRDLLLRGTFGYSAFGHRDSTHLRWFTRRDLEALVQGADWTVVESRPTATLRRTGFLERRTRGLVGELLSPQWQLLARAA
jgi:2-polyprenyl-3-methyl-5-hydroxy-6-metoxy-1,4-benzoquinol methylase